MKYGIGIELDILSPVRKLVGRIEEAARHVPLERLALSPQCGFSTSVLGSALSAADQKLQHNVLYTLRGDAARSFNVIGFPPKSSSFWNVRLMR